MAEKPGKGAAALSPMNQIEAQPVLRIVFRQKPEPINPLAECRRGGSRKPFCLRKPGSSATTSASARTDRTDFSDLIRLRSTNGLPVLSEQ